MSENVGIYGQPNQYGFGLQFNYQVWTPETQLTLCRVPWDASYRDVVMFDTTEDLESYCRNTAYGGAANYYGTTLITPTTPVKVDLPFNDVYTYNYLMVKNPASPADPPYFTTVKDKPRTFFYFINDVQYKAPNTTELHVQLDVWQTFIHYVNFGNCYVERGHIGIANENNFDNYGRDYLTVPEGLDIGGELWVKASWYHSVAANWTPYSVLVASTVDFVVSGGDAANPVMASATGSGLEGLPNGTDLYLFANKNDYQSVMGALQSKPWITSGIVSVIAIPNNMAQNFSGTTVSVPGSSVSFTKLQSSTPAYQEITIKTSWRDAVMPTGRYRHLKKFLTYPYTVVEMTTYSGQPVILKPESIYREDLTIVEMAHLAPPDPRIVFYPRGYNGAPGVSDYLLNGQLYADAGDFLDITTGITDLPMFSVVNNSYLMYMAQNKNRIAYAYQSADWSQNRALAGNQLAANQASMAMQTQNQMTSLGINAANAQMGLANQTLGYRSIQSGTTSVANGVVRAFGGNPVGGITSAVLGAANAAADYAIGSNQNTQSTAINNNLAMSQNAATVARMAYNRDTNKQYADWAANGDYENAIRSINAKVQDAKMIQPTTSGQVGGEAFNLATTGWNVWMKVKQIDNAAMRMVGDYWLRYGYAVNRFSKLPSNLKCMTRFTYWKLKETYLVSSSCPEMFKATIRGIMEKGVTIWNNPDDIGKIDISDNDPLPGVTIG